DNFDYSDLNLLGRKTNAYKKLPSVCKFERVPEEHFGPAGKALKLAYKKEATGWCGYYTLLNQIDGEYYDLSGYKSVSFMVKGKNGGEKFEIGMADKSWIIIGDSLKAGPIDKYLPGGVTCQWQEVVIPLEDFGLLDFSEMGSFVINFHEKGDGTIYIDDLKFYLKEDNKK
ncbi:MAG: CIA30 family protein, partial [Candidatus Omnitrophica bacterium]|nr:CIA30 family protein [Candidatus Omnitrophota bacterium]